MTTKPEHDYAAALTALDRQKKVTSFTDRIEAREAYEAYCAALPAIRSALQIAQGMAWRTDMENAPRDGTRCLIAIEGVNLGKGRYRVTEGYWQEALGGFHGRWVSWGIEVTPAFWAELPTAPQPHDERGGA